MPNEYLHVVEVTGTMTLSDGTKVSFDARADSANSWGGDVAQLGATVDVRDAIAHAIHEESR